MKDSPFSSALSMIREKVATSDLLPEAYVRYRPLLADGLCFFLERLPEERLRKIILQQMRLSPSASTSERVAALLCHAPALHKLGQIVARDHRLSVDFRRRLQKLESLEPQILMPEVLGLLDAEFPSWREQGIVVEQRSLAEGSVAVVVPFVWNEKHAGVFKLLKPNIQGLLEEDLQVLGSLGDFLDKDCTRYHLPELDYRDTFDTVRDLLQHEVRLDEEQSHMIEAKENYACVPAVIIPALFPFCSPRLTAMERIYGDKITDWIPNSSQARETVARRAINALIAQPLFSSNAAALFHADPHAGNLLATPDGRVGILDWSLAGRLRHEDRVQLAQMLLGAVTLNPLQMERAVNELTQKTPNRLVLQSVLKAGLSELTRGTLPGVEWFTELLDNLVTRAGVRFPQDLLLFRKSLLTLNGLVADLAQGDHARQRAILDQAVLSKFLHCWASEWPDRFRAPLTAKSLTTHISTADLLALAWSAPATMGRWWTGVGMDFWQRAAAKTTRGLTPDA